MSHPTMGAWIEIAPLGVNMLERACRTPRWVRGLKLLYGVRSTLSRVVAPHDGCVD